MQGGEKAVDREKGTTRLTPASRSTELQFDTQTSTVSGHVSWVKWAQIGLRQAEMYIKKCVCGEEWNKYTGYAAAI